MSGHPAADLTPCALRHLVLVVGGRSRPTKDSAVDGDYHVCWSATLDGCIPYGERSRRTRRSPASGSSWTEPDVGFQDDSVRWFAETVIDPLKESP